MRGICPNSQTQNPRVKNAKIDLVSVGTVSIHAFSNLKTSVHLLASIQKNIIKNEILANFLFHLETQSGSSTGNSVLGIGATTICHALVLEL